MIKKMTTIKLDKVSKHILLVTLNRPEVSNALNTEMGWDILRLFEELAVNLDEVRVVVLTGSGKKAFCAGGDLKERNQMSDKDWQKQHVVFERMMRAIVGCPIPIVGAINGAAYGGGCEIAAALDFNYASETALFAQTETKLGIIPGSGGTQNLTRVIGEKRAKELILSGKVFSAREAENWGLVNTLCEPSKLIDTVLAAAEIISTNAPIAVRQAKQAIHKGLQMSLLDGLAFEIEAYNRTVNTNDRREGIAAFNEKRKPVFKGE